MTLLDLTEQLAPQFPLSVQKDLKTAIRVLAQALDYADAKSCPLEACQKPVLELYRLIEAALAEQGKGPHTIRNTKNNVSRLFRLADSHGLFTPPPAILARRFKIRDVPSRPHAEYSRRDGSNLMRRAWPPDVEREFSQFCSWATKKIVPGRPKEWKKRPSTLAFYQRLFQVYFGYLHHTKQIRPVCFDHLFDVDLIEQFVDWHSEVKFDRVTPTSEKLVLVVKAMARQYRRDPSVVAALRELVKRMPKATAVLHKDDAWVPLGELERVGVALWPTKPPSALRQRRETKGVTGQLYAAQAAMSLMLRLWVRIPYRQRNIREMQLDDHLHKNSEGKWRIRFEGEQLKVAKKHGKDNIFDLPFPPDLVPTLEAYRTTWRPILAKIIKAEDPEKAMPPELFLNQKGKPFTANDLNRKVRRTVYSFTGQYFHPHMIRTIWATEWIKNTGDFMGAAIMLNDTLETVIKRYAHLRDEGVAETAFKWVQHRVSA